MGTQLQRLDTADASREQFVQKHMARGELVVCATKYTQTPLSCLAQVSIVGVPAGVIGGIVAGSVVAGLAVAGLATMVLGGLVLALEATNRLVLTEQALVVQSSAKVRRFERHRISDARVEILSVRQWARLDTMLLDPAYFVRKGAGLRFEYERANGKTRQVFVGTPDAYELLGLLNQ